MRQPEIRKARPHRARSRISQERKQQVLLACPTVAERDRLIEGSDGQRPHGFIILGRGQDPVRAN